MIEITDFLSYAEVRAVLGVEIYELTDETLALPLYARGLQSRLRGVTGTFSGTTGSLLAIWDALDAVVTPSTAQANMIDDIKQLAVYIVAAECLSGLSLFAPKATSDGKSMQTRFMSDDSIASLYSMVQYKLMSCLSSIVEATGGTVAMSPTTFIQVIKPVPDRVTGQ